MAIGAHVRHRLLIADDNREAADTLATVLGLSGFDTRVAYDGQHAVAAALNFSPAAAILDLGMPTMDGCAAARVIRNSSIGRRVVLVALTGRSTSWDVQEAEAAGFDVCLNKPVVVEDLALLLRQALGSRSPRRALSHVRRR